MEGRAPADTEEPRDSGRYAGNNGFNFLVIEAKLNCSMVQQAFEDNLVNLQSTLIRKLAPYRWDPLGFCEKVFPWGSGELTNSAGPRPWQRQLLTHIGQHLQNPATRHQPTLNAVSSGHGIGKSHPGRNAYAVGYVSARLESSDHREHRSAVAHQNVARTGEMVSPGIA